MAPSIQNQQDYDKASAAYVRGDYQTASIMTEQLVKEFPDNATYRLLRGHINLVLEKYQTAIDDYQSALQLTSDNSIIENANWGMQTASDRLKQDMEDEESDDFNETDQTTNQNLEDKFPESPDFNDDFDAIDDPFAFDVDEFSTQVTNIQSINRTNFQATPTVLDIGATKSPLDNEPDINFNTFDVNGDFNFNGVDLDQANQFDNVDNNIDFSDITEAVVNESAKTIAPNDNDVLFINEFDEFDNLSDISAFPTAFDDSDATQMVTGGEVSGFNPAQKSAKFSSSPTTPPRDSGKKPNVSSSSTTSKQPATALPPPKEDMFSFFDNMSLRSKSLFISLFSGFTAAIAIGFVGTSTISDVLTQEESPTTFTKQQVITTVTNLSLIMALSAGASSAFVTIVICLRALGRIKKTTDNLQTQFELVIRGDMNPKAIIYSADEFGKLANTFNQMIQSILNSTIEAQRKAEEQEQSKEDLQRQVIRLLDDVEGAARGDLTVQAEVTADVLGAVADSFNLTIQNLREIVQQVKLAAKQVSEGSKENESFARSLSSDALRQAEELSVTLNSVQVMTESIQRVAENAREAEQVAKLASQTALKGGEAVERTVSGILDIRETVAETTRKVKRLGESSQEISKIVSLISQISQRTNLLALNSSIEAARAGEAGRGFAIVADEVRQLADRAAKASKDIEKIVFQIQGDTGSLQQAMDKGTQQVIDGTKRAEQAKQSLVDIIQVSQRIDRLVRSITEDTIKQTETSRTVAQVMQSVELTAQETSQESQRVSASLQNLVGVARSLQDSVERFRVDSDHTSDNV